jgi:hypothetical protein
MIAGSLGFLLPRHSQQMHIPSHDPSHEYKTHMFLHGKDLVSDCVIFMLRTSARFWARVSKLFFHESFHFSTISLLTISEGGQGFEPTIWTNDNAIHHGCHYASQKLQTLTTSWGNGCARQIGCFKKIKRLMFCTWTFRAPLCTSCAHVFHSVYLAEIVRVRAAHSRVTDCAPQR